MKITWPEGFQIFYFLMNKYFERVNEYKIFDTFKWIDKIFLSMSAAHREDMQEKHEIRL